MKKNLLLTLFILITSCHPVGDRRPANLLTKTCKQLVSFFIKSQETRHTLLNEKETKEELSEESFKKVTPVYNSIVEYAKNFSNPDYIASQVNVKSLLKEALDSDIIKFQKTFKRKPESLVLLPGKSPNYKNLISSYKTTSTLEDGTLDAYVYLSHDKSVEYILVKNSNNKVWFSHIESTENALNDHGLKRDVFNPEELLTPLWEYSAQLPPKYHGPQNTKGPNYIEAWKYLKEIPIIKEWYKYNQAEIPK